MCHVALVFKGKNLCYTKFKFIEWPLPHELLHRLPLVFIVTHHCVHSNEAEKSEALRDATQKQLDLSSVWLPATDRQWIMGTGAPTHTHGHTQKWTSLSQQNKDRTKGDPPGHSHLVFRLSSHPLLWFLSQFLSFHTSLSFPSLSNKSDNIVVSNAVVRSLRSLHHLCRLANFLDLFLWVRNVFTWNLLNKSDLIQGKWQLKEILCCCLSPNNGDMHIVWTQISISIMITKLQMFHY